MRYAQTATTALLDREVAKIEEAGIQVPVIAALHQNVYALARRQENESMDWDALVVGVAGQAGERLASFAGVSTAARLIYHASYAGQYTINPSYFARRGHRKMPHLRRLALHGE